MKNSIGVDIGATKIIFGLLKNRKVIKKKKIPTPKTKKIIIKELKENLRDLKKSSDLKIDRIGIGVPGILDIKKGLILKCPNLRYLDNLPLVKILEKELKIKTSIENDTNCFTLAEALFGAGKNKNIVFGITLGSGVGGGLVIRTCLSSQRSCSLRAARQNLDSVHSEAVHCELLKYKSNNLELKDKNKIKIYRGAFGTAGEIGHQTIKFDGQKCSCGNLGCFEYYCSAKFFKRKGYSAKELTEKAKRNNRKALRIFKEYGKYLGIGLSNIINLIEPEIIVVGGGISKSWPYFLAETKKEIKKRIISPVSKKYTKVEISKLGDLAGSIGAGLIND